MDFSRIFFRKGVEFLRIFSKGHIFFRKDMNFSILYLRDMNFTSLYLRDVNFLKRTWIFKVFFFQKEVIFFKRTQVGFFLKALDILRFKWTWNLRMLKKRKFFKHKDADFF